MTRWIDILGWTLLHFVWQGALIAMFAALILRLLRSSRPQLRYAVACAALTAMLVVPAAWYLMHRRRVAIGLASSKLNPAT